MSKRLFMLLIALVFVSFFSGVSFTQNSETNTAVDGDYTDSYISPVSNAEEPDSLRYSAPKPVIYFDGYNTYINTRVAYKLSAKDDLAQHKTYYRINGGSEREYNAPFSFETEGRHTITYRSSDRMERRGNENTFTVILDDSAPNVVLLSEMPVIVKDEKTIYIAPDTVFTIKASDTYSGVSSVFYSVSGDAMAEYQRSFLIPQDAKEFDVQIVATDNVGISTNSYTIKAKDKNNKDVDVSSVNVQYVTDMTPPDVVIAADKEIFQNDKGQNIVAKDYSYSITATDEESGVSSILYRISGEKDFKAYTQPFVLKNVGINKIEAKAVDKVGNVGTPVALTVFVDVVPPATSIRPIVDESAE